MIVVDSSIVIDALIGEESERKRLREEKVIAPCLIDAEVGHAVRRMVRRERFDATVGAAALEELRRFDISMVSHDPLLVRAWELRDNASFYDALYIALAELSGCNLVTRDARLAGIPGIRASVEVIA